MADYKTADTGEALTLAQRRAFMALPLEERRRQMAKQADKMLESYEGEEETAARQDWPGGDIVDSK